MAWTPKNGELTIDFDQADLDHYRADDPTGRYFDVRWPRSIGKSHHGEFPLVVAREAFRRRGFTVWASEPELPHDGGFILVAYPGKRERRHPAYERMVAMFGEATLRRLNRTADEEKERHSKSRGGGDPDLFVFRGEERYFVEMKWADHITPKQDITFPLTEKHCGVPIRVARIAPGKSQLPNIRMQPTRRGAL